MQEMSFHSGLKTAAALSLAVGAIFAGGVAMQAGPTTGAWIVVPILLAGVLGGMVWAGIVALLERAQAERPRLAKAADRAAAWFLSRILLGSALVFVVWWFVDPSKAFPATLAVLVVTCPCALSLAPPAVLAAATADLICCTIRSAKATLFFLACSKLALSVSRNSRLSSEQ